MAGSSHQLESVFICTLFLASLLHPPVRCHAHGAHGRTAVDEKGNRFHDSNIVQDQEHIKEHLQELYDLDKKNISEMSAEELEFYYFKLHDFNNDSRLDGLEILTALSHMMPYEDMHEVKAEIQQRLKEGKAPPSPQEMQAEALVYYTELIDQVLQDDDFNNDGYLTYLEYVLARRRDEEKYARQKSEH
ncbi:PREDICTED: multiple coagulation factor deficiency protein 2 homolog [Branchiostoma belcheri]|uniref:Multiple coagulation factor deficiency protein 2 homolog n=1 Tax=Branchiostoma belcheri TaxID=7741 RepID=A0A6P4ZRN5_BRABE|nr:PREDICTED: multiple coagulation factor deficiency protein 2 homolog [Branchiostoma belcheri]